MTEVQAVYDDRKSHISHDAIRVDLDDVGRVLESRGYFSHDEVQTRSLLSLAQSAERLSDALERLAMTVEADGHWYVNTGSPQK